MKLLKTFLTVAAMAVVSATIQTLVSREIQKFLDKKDAKNKPKQSYSNLH